MVRKAYNTGSFYFDGKRIESTTSLNILGCEFQSDAKSDIHVEKSIKKCCQSYFALSEVGICYPGLDSTTKAV